MKKYILLALLGLLSLLFFSCKEEEDNNNGNITTPVNSMDISGVYYVDIYHNNVEVLDRGYFVIKRKDANSFYLSLLYHDETLYSPLTIVSVYDSNRVKGEFLLPDPPNSGEWITCEFDAVYSDNNTDVYPYPLDSISGTWKGRYFYYGSPSFPAGYTDVENGIFILRKIPVFNEETIPPFPYPKK
jgi:hypothetical protein